MTVFLGGGVCVITINVLRKNYIKKHSSPQKTLLKLGIMDRSVFEILDAIGVNLLRLLIHDYLPQRFHAKQFYDLLINHHPLEYREMRNRYAHKPEQEIDGIVNAQISQYLLKRSSELNISKIENCYHKYTSHNNNSSQVSYWQHR